ncbi:glycosyltransferase [Candidatus Pelagibacter sp.]|nr:glycosyltransferase [Candidatus Pelagibacter sp.]
MIQQNQKLSIVTPNLNGGKYIEQTIKSVINQKNIDIEYIIIDGGSTDDSHAIIKKYLKHIKHFRIKKDKNMYEAVKYGFSLASGNILTWINSDDFYYKNCLSKILKKINERNLNWVNCISSSLHKKNYFTYPYPFYFPRNYILKEKCHKSDYGFIPQESTFFSKKLYFKCGQIPIRYKYAGDFYLWKKMAKYEKLHPLNVKCAIFRKRKGQLSGNMNAYYKEIKKKYFYKSNFLRLFVSFFYFIFFYRKI